MVGSLLIDGVAARHLLARHLCACWWCCSAPCLSESRDPEATGRIDGVGVIVGTAAVALTMYAIVQSESWGVTDPRIALFGIVGVVLAVVLVRRSRTHPEPLLNLELFAFRSFRSANIGVVFYGLAFTAGFLVNSILLQDVWDLVREVGLALAPSPLLAAVVSPITGRWADRVGHRWLLVVDVSLAVAFLAFVLLPARSRRCGPVSCR